MFSPFVDAPPRLPAKPMDEIPWYLDVGSADLTFSAVVAVTALAVFFGGLRRLWNSG